MFLAVPLRGQHARVIQRLVRLLDEVAGHVGVAERQAVDGAQPAPGEDAEAGLHFLGEGAAEGDDGGGSVGDDAGGKLLRQGGRRLHVHQPALRRKPDSLLPFKEAEAVDAPTVPLRQVQMGVNKARQDPAAGIAQHLAPRRLARTRRLNPSVSVNPNLPILDYPAVAGGHGLQQSTNESLHPRLLRQTQTRISRPLSSPSFVP